MNHLDDNSFSSRLEIHSRFYGSVGAYDYRHESDKNREQHSNYKEKNIFLQEFVRNVIFQIHYNNYLQL